MADIKKKGTKQEVFDGKALCTSGGLKKDDLILNHRGNIVSKKRSEQGKKQYGNLQKYREERKQPKAPAEDLKVSPIQEIKEEKKEEGNEFELPNKAKETKEIKEELGGGVPKGLKVRKYTSRKIKNENPVVDEIQFGDKFPIPQ